MALNFPNSPTLNQIYTAGNRSWQWNGRFWQSISVTVGYTGSRGLASIFKSSVPTEQDLPIPYGGDEGDGFLVESTGFMWIWDGSSWGSLGRFTGFTGSQGAPGSSVKIIGSVPTVQDLPSDGTSDGSTLLLPGDGFIVQDSGDLYLWTGSEWTNIGKITGDAGPAGFTGSQGFTGSVGFVGSKGESSFTWGPNPPQNPLVGDRWYDTSELVLLVYLDDGDSLQWVEVNAAGFQGQTGQVGYTGSAQAGPVQIFDDTVTGNLVIPPGKNGLTVGTVTLAPGATINIAPGQRWVII